KTMSRLSARSAAIPCRAAAAAARRTTPGPQSTRYARPPAITAADGPERSGSGLGVPVPSMTTRGESPLPKASAAVRTRPSTKRILSRMDGLSAWRRLRRAAAIEVGLLEPRHQLLAAIVEALAAARRVTRERVGGEQRQSDGRVGVADHR